MTCPSCGGELVELDAAAAEKLYSYPRSHKKHKKRESVLDDLFG